MKKHGKWYDIHMSVSDDLYDRMANWCDNNIKNNKWKSNVNVEKNSPPMGTQSAWIPHWSSKFEFKHEADLILFKLTWIYDR